MIKRDIKYITTYASIISTSYQHHKFFRCLHYLICSCLEMRRLKEIIHFKSLPYPSIPTLISLLFSGYRWSLSSIQTQYAHDVVLTSIRRRFNVMDVVWTSKRRLVLTGKRKEDISYLQCILLNVFPAGSGTLFHKNMFGYPHLWTKYIMHHDFSAQV